MNREIIIELQFFITSILWGVLLLVLYDSIRIIRRVVTHNSFFIALEDLLYWMVSGLLIFRMMYQQNNGIIRWFSIGGVLIGMLLYHNSLSNPLVNAISNIINSILGTIKKALLFLLRILFTPFRLIGKGFKKIFTFLYKKVKKLAKFLLKLLKSKKKDSRIDTIEKEEW